ncbi:hypothetical protein EKD04_020075 [Chloroflexales bacterium ZM16-3]|nr:hypothetical protein [Chloroflexales bacterium ZM16-3]
MFRDDYIMRMIRQFGQIYAYILGMRRRGQYPLALIAIDNAYRERLGLGSDAVAALSDSQILALVRFGETNGSWRETGAFVASLLYSEAVILQEQGQPDDATPRAMLSLQLLLECDLASDQPLPEYAPPRDELLGMLSDYELPAKTRAALFTLLARAGRYAHAEDVLAVLLDERPTDAGLIGAGVSFYEGLLDRDDADLEAGGLPRDEVLAALTALRATVVTDNS